MTGKRKTKNKRVGAPKWATQPFRDFLDHTERLGYLLDLSIKGISMIRSVPKIVQVLAKVEGDNGEQTQKKLEEAKKEAELAHREVNEDFPLLRAQYIIALWSALEATIRLFIVKWLKNHKQAMEIDEIQKLRVKIGDYERLKGEDRFFYILDRLEQELAGSLKSGVTRFESLLDPFGLSGSVDKDVRRNLFELNQVRNILVHRSGFVDRRFVDSCPWMKLRVGDQVKVSQEMISYYSESVMNYALELIMRIAEYFGVNMSEFRSKANTINQ